MKTGRLVAVCISATSSGEGVSEVISQAAPTLCIQVPMLDVIAAIQTARKAARRSGLQGEAPGSGLLASFRLAVSSDGKDVTHPG